jgi:DNA invertase Pin-like site-specific DNA recombinase
VVEQMSKRRVCLYARVSTHDQATGLESQVRALKDYCRLNDIQEYEIFSDEGISGTKASRPALDRMMKAVRDNEVDCVVVYSFSRFARSTTHMLAGLEDMKKANTNFVSLTEKVDTNSPIGKAIFVIISAIAALERDLIAERVKNGLANARAKGKQIGRKKLRDSNLIRSLLKVGMSFRQISLVAKCSHGSVSAEKKAMLRDEELAKLKQIEQTKADEAARAPTVLFPDPDPTKAA